jgi:anti-anti-sigma factor
MAEFHLDGDKLTIEGHLEGHDDQEFRAVCLELQVDEAKVLTVDMQGVTSIGSSSVGILVSLWTDLIVSGRRFRLLPSDKVRRVLDLGGLTGVFLGRPG